MTTKKLTFDYLKEIVYFKRYAVSGVINTIVGFIFIFSAMMIGFSPITSNVIGYAVGFMMGFVLSKKFVFRSDGYFVGESIRYLLSFAASFLLNLLVLHLSLEYLHFHAMFAQVVAAASYTSFMYLFSRLFVFSAATISPNASGMN